MQVWPVKSTDCDDRAYIAGVYTTQGKAEAARAAMLAQRPKTSVWVDEPFELDATPRFEY